jgi:indole-3-glycerol phosphate synthase
MTQNTLEKICADKADHVAVQKSKIPLSVLESKVSDLPKLQGDLFLNALQEKYHIDGFSLITEVKKASPSRGIIRADFDPVAIAKAYEESGAACFSVLTDIPYFQGDDRYLQDIAQHTSRPILRKDFFIDPYQIFEARLLGACCILLIIAALSDKDFIALYTIARDIGMDVLIEAHTGDEIKRALDLRSDAPALLGVNCRDLKTLNVDPAYHFDLLPLIPTESFAIAESGIVTHDDLKIRAQAGYKGFLVGESLMRQQDIAQATLKLRGKI